MSRNENQGLGARVRVTTYDADLSEAADQFLNEVHAEDRIDFFGENSTEPIMSVKRSESPEFFECWDKGQELRKQPIPKIGVELKDHQDPSKWEPEPPNQFQQITNALADLLAYKNMKHGNSALNPLNVFTGKSKVGQRLDDKLSRIQNSDELRKNDVADVIGYLILVCKENNWTTFDEFKD